MIKFENVCAPDKIWQAGISSETEKREVFNQAVACPPGNALEIGAFYGANLLTIAKVFQLLNKPGKVYSIDIWLKEFYNGDLTYRNEGFEDPQDYVRACIEEHGLRDRIELLTGDSLEFGKTWSTPLSLLIIDGKHEEPYVRKDAGNFMPQVIRGGIIMFHDYHATWPGVTKVVNEIRAANPDWAFSQVDSFAVFRRPI
jgi:Methyltransferase domain